MASVPAQCTSTKAGRYLYIKNSPPGAIIPAERKEKIMYFKLIYGASPITCAEENFEARSEKEAAAKARRKIAAAVKDGRYEPDYHGPVKLYYYGPGEYEVWKGDMWYGGEPTYEQRHEVAL